MILRGAFQGKILIFLFEEDLPKILDYYVENNLGKEPGKLIFHFLDQGGKKNQRLYDAPF